MASEYSVRKTDREIDRETSFDVYGTLCKTRILNKIDSESEPKSVITDTGVSEVSSLTYPTLPGKLFRMRPAKVNETQECKSVYRPLR